MPPEHVPQPGTSESLAGVVRDGLRIVWSAGAKHCVAMGVGALLAALLAPISILAMGIIVSEINEMIATGDTASGSLDLWILLVAAVACLAIVLGAAQEFAKMRLQDSLSLEMQRKILRHAATLDASVLDDRSCQNTLERAGQNPGQKILDLLEGIIQSVSGILQIGTLIAVLVWIEPWWTLGLVVALAPVFVASYWVSQIKHHYNRIRTTERRWTKYYARLLTHRDWSQSVKVLGLAGVMLDRHDRQMDQLLDDNRRIGLLRMAIRFVTSLILLVLIGGATWFAAHRAATGELDVGMFTAFWLAAWKFRDSAGRIGNSISSIMDARLAIGHLNDFFSLRPRMKDSGTLTPEIAGTISLRDVSFRYSPDSSPVLEDVTLDIRPGEIVALVGPNGAGKSTLAKLIARLYEPSSGTILVDGVPIDQIKHAHYYRHVALVQQTPPRFEATAGDNIAFGDWDSLRDQPAAIRQIAAIAGADELVDRLPLGLDTMLGRMFGEHDLSGGQWKKLALARALAGEPRIVILDEPAANLDIQTERLVHDQLKAMLKGRTAVLISHHFSSVLMADRILVIVDGRIAEQGTHAELRDAGGIYASMCRNHREMTDEHAGDQNRAAA